MPTNGHTAVLVQVDIAAIRPQGSIVEAADGHHQLHDFDHPWWKYLRLHLDTAVAVCAIAATWSHHPRCLARYRPSRPFWLFPLCAIPRFLKKFFGLITSEGGRQECREGSSALIIQDVEPSSCAITKFTYQGQLYLTSGPFPQGIRVLVRLWPSLTLTSSLCTISLGVALEALGLGAKDVYTTAWACPIARTFLTLLTFLAFVSFALSLSLSFSLSLLHRFACWGSVCQIMRISAAITTSAHSTFEVAAHFLLLRRRRSCSATSSCGLIPWRPSSTHPR
mmetsp:Transcript_42538/g.77238  ORF Transcript_42538/g.77238 Transcript_42538/m.77238 type:complete len:280 (+) Transcript_42538:398-1237(+)